MAAEKAAAAAAVTEEAAMREAGMQVRVRYFAAAAEASGCEEETLTFDDGATLGDLKALLADRYGERMLRVLRTGSFLLDRVVRREPSHPLAASVDVLPPFAGG